MTNKMIVNAISAVLALGVSSASTAALAEGTPTQQMNEIMNGNVTGMEKCYGIAKANQNDCGTASHSCAGEAKLPSSKADWLFVPTGLCDKIVGGSLSEPKKG